jgi:hypothetical protein
MNSLLGHLALSFASSPENIATEALAYVLEHSQAARDAMMGFAAGFEPALRSQSLVFRTQASAESGAIPDLVGRSASGETPLIIEAKFWAGLTRRQPVEYLDCLPQGSGTLMFVAPERRFETLWPELHRRVAAAGMAVEETQTSGDSRSATIDGRQVLVLTSWRTLLSRLESAAEGADDREAAVDLRQLQGLCARQDRDAFRPIRSEDLTDDLGYRIVQWCNLVNALVEKAITSGVASKKGLRAVGGDGWWGHYVRLADVGVLIHFSPAKWSRLRATPLWIRIEGENFSADSGMKCRDALAPLESRRPAKLLVNPQNDFLEVPLDVPLGLERDDVLENLLGQVREVAALLAERVPTGAAKSSVAPFTRDDLPAGQDIALVYPSV